MTDENPKVPGENPEMPESKGEEGISRREACKYLGALAGLFGAKLVGCGGRTVGGPDNQDAGVEGCDAGSEQEDSGVEGCDAGPETCWAERPSTDTPDNRKA